MEKVTKGKIGAVEFQFNPANLNETMELKYNNPIRKVLHYVKTNPITTELHIFLDDNYAKQPGYTMEAIYNLGEYVSEIENDAPPVVLFSYGESIYWVVIEKIEVVKMIRGADNVSTQAEVILGIKEHIEDETHRTRREQKGRRFLFISQGDNATFRKLAYLTYNNAELWQAISDYNQNVLIRMLGPIIPAGTRIEIPAWSIAKTYLNTPQTGLVKYD